MTTTTYIWAWKDGENVYVNADTSLESIIEEIIEYYKGESVDEISIINNGESFAISFFDEDDDEQKEYDIKTEPWAVAEFLREYAEECNREDWFDIKEIEAESNRADTFEIEKI